MQLKQLLEEDDAVSPVIGVILMVAITVILAAVIATFVLGLGEQVSSTAPSTSFSFDLNETSSANAFTDDFSNAGCGGSSQSGLVIRHAGGPTIDPATLTVAGSTPAGTADWTTAQSSDVSAGDSVEICINDGDTVDVTWEQEGDSAILATYRGPDA